MAERFTPFDPSAAAATERSHAARNRRRVLDAALCLFTERAPEHVTMEDVARRAGVGKGTVYRRFGDRAGLALAVLDAQTRGLQGAVLAGEPPLGPGAPARERLRAFLAALAAQTEAHLPLVLVAETATPGARYRSQVYATWRLHVAVLLRDLLPGHEPGLLPDALLAPLSADMYRHLREDRGMSAAAVAAALDDMALAVAGPGPT